MSVGSIKKVVLAGITFSVMGDANLSQIKGKFATESITTSGGNILKKTLRSQNTESTNLFADAEEGDILKNLSENINNFPMSYETADGTVFRAVGGIDFESHDTDAGLAVIKMIPESNDGWARF